MKTINILVIVMILVIIGVVIYIYYDQLNNTENKKYINIKKICKSNRFKRKKSSDSKKISNSKKRVTFDPTVTYVSPPIHEAPNNSLSISKIFNDDTTIDSLGIWSSTPRESISIQVQSPPDSIFDNYQSYYKPNTLSPSIIKSASPSLDIDNDDVIPANDDYGDENDEWDSNFGIPLVEENQKKKFGRQLRKEYDKYYDSFDNFNKKYQDMSDLVEEREKIDPFDESNAKYFEGKTIGEIFDEQNAGPILKNKKVKKVGTNEIIYEDEKKINGGYFYKCGKNNVHAYHWDPSKSDYKSSDIHNEF
jgi:hypothetical protein